MYLSSLKLDEPHIHLNLIRIIVIYNLQLGTYVLNFGLQGGHRNKLE